MVDSKLTITALKDSGDGRGGSFPVPEALLAGGFPVFDAHLSTLMPGHVRGDHFHVARNEILLVMSADRWSLHWDNGEGTPVEVRVFEGPGAVVIRVPPNAAHAIRNDGNMPLQIVGLTDGPFDPAAPDSYPRRVTGSGTSATPAG